MSQIILFISDIIMLYGALFLTLFLRYPKPEFNRLLDTHFTPFSIIFGFWLLSFYITNLYERRSWRNTVEFFSSLMRAGIFATLLSISLFYLVPTFGITPRANLALFTVIFGILIVIARSIFNQAFLRRFKKPIIFIGGNPQTHELDSYIRNNPQLGYYSRGTIEPDASDAIAVMQDIIIRKHVDIVIISPEAYKMPELINLFYQSLERRIEFKNLASFYEQVTGRVPLGAIDQVWFLENLTESSKRAYEVAKRVFDIILAIALGIMFLVFFPFLAVIIKITSSGQILYRQARMGLKGQTFNILKLRTMRTDAESKTGAIWAQDNDPRITRLGRLLRKSRMDEFPQLWNILKGEMSFVGPRAERPEFHQRLKAEVPFYEERYLIKPGLSGWAQINYQYGASVADAAQKLQYDLYYIKHRSLVLDLGIILKTLNISVRQAGR